MVVTQPNPRPPLVHRKVSGGFPSTWCTKGLCHSATDRAATRARRPGNPPKPLAPPLTPTPSHNLPDTIRLVVTPQTPQGSLSTSQRQTVVSSLPEARYLPSGEKATENTQLWCPISIPRQVTLSTQLFTSQLVSRVKCIPLEKMSRKIVKLSAHESVFNTESPHPQSASQQEAEPYSA